MPSHFIRFDPDTVALLDRCLARAEHIASQIDPTADRTDIRQRLASALIEAVRLGEEDEAQLMEFALRVLPAYREGRVRAVAVAAPAQAS